MNKNNQSAESVDLDMDLESTETTSTKGAGARAALVIIVVLALVVLASLAKSQGWLPFLAAADQPDKDLNQAVFLTNGQVYFGELKKSGSDYVLTDVFYLQVVQPLQQQPPNQQPPSDQPQLNLIKMGSEIHGPTSKMVIPKTSVVFWEDIRDEGTVGKAIAEFERRQANGGTGQQQQVPQQ